MNTSGADGVHQSPAEAVADRALAQSCLCGRNHVLTCTHSTPPPDGTLPATARRFHGAVAAPKTEPRQKEAPVLLGFCFYLFRHALPPAKAVEVARLHREETNTFPLRCHAIKHATHASFLKTKHAGSRWPKQGMLRSVCTHGGSHTTKFA